MPSVEQVLAGLRNNANAWQPVAAVWHLGLAIFSLCLILGARPSKRTAGILLALPLLSVSAIAWLSSNPFNGIVFALLTVFAVTVSRRLAHEPVRIAVPWLSIPGMLMVCFGWIYPHFLDASSWLRYFYAAPTGLIPCPTLSIVIGFALVFGGLGSRTFSFLLGIPGLFYGLTGVFQLGVSIDWLLIAGAILVSTAPFLKSSRAASEAGQPPVNRMTVWGVGRRIAFISLAYLAVAEIVHMDNPGMMTIPGISTIPFSIFGIILIVPGFLLWAGGFRRIDSAFNEGKLLTGGVYSLVRNPMYSGFIVFIAPGAAILQRSWALMSVAVFAYSVFRALIRKEESYLETKFGQSYLDYKARVPSIVPFAGIFSKRHSVLKEE